MQTERQLRRTRKKKHWRLSQKGKNRLLFIAVLLVLFGASYGITTLTLMITAKTPASPPVDPAAKPVGESIEVSSPVPTTDPKLPHIISGKTHAEEELPVSKEPSSTELPDEKEDPLEEETDLSEKDESDENESQTTPEEEPENKED